MIYKKELKKIKLAGGIEISEPLIIDLSLLNLNNYVEHKIEHREKGAAGYFELYFNSGDFVTRSAPTDSWIAVIPAIKAVGITPSYTVYRLINLDTGEVLENYSLRSFQDGEKWNFRHVSNTGSYPFPFMPDHDWHLRVQLEYPEGTVYKQRDVTIINGPRSGLNPKCEIIKPDLPVELAPDSDLKIPNLMKNIGNEVGNIGLCGYITPNCRHLIFIDILPIHPEFNSTGFTIGTKMRYLHEYLRWVGYSSINDEYIQDSNIEEHTILCTDPTKCNCSLTPIPTPTPGPTPTPPECSTEQECYEYSKQVGGTCFWSTLCEIPTSSCKSYLSSFMEHYDAPGPLSKYDNRFDFDMNGIIDISDLIAILAYFNHNPPESYKVLFNCNPDIDGYSHELKEWWKADMKFDENISDRLVKEILGPLETNRRLVLITSGWHVSNNINRTAGCASDILQIDIDEVDIDGYIIKTIASYRTDGRLSKGRHEITNDLSNTYDFSRRYQDEKIYLAVSIWGKNTESKITS